MGKQKALRNALEPIFEREFCEQKARIRRAFPHYSAKSYESGQNRNLRRRLRPEIGCGNARTGNLAL